MNRLPEVKRFIKTSGHADAYENLKITFIPGHTPKLYIKLDNGQVEEEDLTNLTTDQLVRFSSIRILFLLLIILVCSLYLLFSLCSTN